MLDQIRKLVGPSKEEMEIPNVIARQLSQQLDRDVGVVPKFKTILHPDEMWKEDDYMLPTPKTGEENG